MSDTSYVDARPRVLLVDERPERRAVMRVIIESGDSGGVVVAEAGGVAAAVTAAVGAELDAAVVEIQIPVAGGLATIAALRQQSPTLTIVVCSFRSDLAVQAAAFAAGATTYLPKPVSAKEVRRACCLPAATDRRAVRRQLCMGEMRWCKRWG